MAIIIALFGYIIWDRRTALKPLEERINKREQDIEIRHENGSKINRLIQALKNLSINNRQMADEFNRCNV